jgi:phosphate uptake regulator
MKRLIILLVLVAGFCFTSHKASAQVSTAQDMQQLILDIEKLTQFKAILGDMKTGYTLLTQGYQQVKDISEGNFNLHSAFLNSLMMVSPVVRKYGRIADIIEDQAEIVSEYKLTLKEANGSGHFSIQEMVYMNGVFNSLLNQSVNNLTTLADIITDNRLRMSDAERLKSIDELYSDTQNKLTFLRSFDNQVAVLALQRQQEQNDVNTIQRLF